MLIEYFSKYILKGITEVRVQVFPLVGMAQPVQHLTVTGVLTAPR